MLPLVYKIKTRRKEKLGAGGEKLVFKKSIQNPTQFIKFLFSSEGVVVESVLWKREFTSSMII